MINKYLITSKEFYSDTPRVFCSVLYNQLKKYQPDYVLYRDKLNPHYNSMAKNFVETCKKLDSVKPFIHQNIDLAKELNAVGVHLTSTQFDEIAYAKELGLEVIISTHTHEEVLKAQGAGADAVTYSPIFASPGKGEPKGLNDLKEILCKCDIKVFALGGIVEDMQIKEVEKLGVYGFASIRYFY